MKNSLLFAGGWNNNPTIQQFKGAFRKLIARAGAIHGCTENAVAHESTELVRAALSSYVPPNNIRGDGEEDARDIPVVSVEAFHDV
jgi:hypothetical protein